MSLTATALPALAYDPLPDRGLGEHWLENEQTLQAEIVRLRFEAEAMEAELSRALDLSRTRRERDGRIHRIAQLEAELGPALRDHVRMAGRIAELDAELQRRDREHRRLSLQIQEMDAALQERDRRIRGMRGSLSWRLAAPLRALERRWA